MIPASAPVWEPAEMRAAPLPGCSRTIGFQANARSASARNACGRRICSMNNTTARVGIVEHECEKVLASKVGLVAGRYGVCDAEVLGQQSGAQRRRAPALRDDAHGGAAGNRLRRDGLEGQ
jgi:hypothetical protein